MTHKTLSLSLSLLFFACFLFVSCDNDGPSSVNEEEPGQNNKGLSIALSENPKPIKGKLCGFYTVTLTFSTALTSTPSSITFSNWVNDNEGSLANPNLPSTGWTLGNGGTTLTITNFSGNADWSSQADAYTVDVSLAGGDTYTDSNVAISEYSGC